MMLKKQTVWLLTMLSLMIVLSVYYMTSPSEDEVAFIDQENQQDAENVHSNVDGHKGDDATGKQTVTSSLNSDQFFTAARLQIEDSRSKLKEQYKEIVASSSVSAEEVNKAINEMNRLQEYSVKENLLEQTIAAKASYPDVLVRAEREKIYVTVKANELSEADTVDIMRMVYAEFGEMPVDVEFQPYEQ